MQVYDRFISAVDFVEKQFLQVSVVTELTTCNLEHYRLSL